MRPLAYKRVTEQGMVFILHYNEAQNYYHCQLSNTAIRENDAKKLNYVPLYSEEDIKKAQEELPTADQARFAIQLLRQARFDLPNGIERLESMLPYLTRIANGLKQ